MNHDSFQLQWFSRFTFVLRSLFSDTISDTCWPENISGAYCLSVMTFASNDGWSAACAARPLVCFESPDNLFLSFTRLVREDKLVTDLEVAAWNKTPNPWVTWKATLTYSTFTEHFTTAASTLANTNQISFVNNRHECLLACSTRGILNKPVRVK